MARPTDCSLFPLDLFYCAYAVRNINVIVNCAGDELHFNTRLHILKRQLKVFLLSLWCPRLVLPACSGGRGAGAGEQLLALRLSLFDVSSRFVCGLRSIFKNIAAALNAA